MIIDINQLASWMTTMGIVLGAFFSAYKLFDRHLIKRFALLEEKIATLENHCNSIEKWTKKQQQDIDDSMEEKQLLLEGVLACLDGLHQQNCNGMVTKNIEKIQRFLNERAHQTKSGQKK